MSINDQPDPLLCPDHVPVWSLVIADFKALQCADLGTDTFDSTDPIDSKIVADMEDRDRLGRVPYGMPLTAGNGRDHLVDAYQEALNLAVYLRAWLEEHPKPSIVDASTEIIGRTWRLTVNISEVSAIYKATLRQLMNIRRLLNEFERPVQ